MAEQTLPVASGMPLEQPAAGAKSEAGQPWVAPSFDRILEDIRTKDDAVRSRFIDRATLAARRTMQVGSLLAIGATFSGANTSRQPLETSRAAVMTEALTEARPMQAEPPYKVVSADRGLRAEANVDSDAKRLAGDAAETQVILDAMLITERVPPGTPLALRMGEIPDERIRAIVAEIDETLGGRIEWPNVYVTPGLTEDGTAAKYEFYPRDHGGRTVTPEENAEHTGAERFGIHLDADLVESELASCSPGGLSIRAALVHEAQHAMSHDASAELLAAAKENYEPYRTTDGGPSFSSLSESRADLAMLVYADMAQRPEGAGPRLNELAPEQRRQIVRGVIEEHLTPVEQPPMEVADERLYDALRETRYLGDPSHKVWAEASDRRTTRYVRGMDVYSESQPFVPTHKPDLERRRAQLATPLDELAERWQADRAARPVTYEEWEQQQGQTPIAEPEYHEKGDDPNELTQVFGRLRQGCAPDQLGVGGIGSAGSPTRSQVSGDGDPDRGAEAPPNGKTTITGQADDQGRSGLRGGPAAQSPPAAPPRDVAQLHRQSQPTVETQPDLRRPVAPSDPGRPAAAPAEQAARAAAALAARRDRQAEVQGAGGGPMSQLRGYAATAWARLQTAVRRPPTIAAIVRTPEPPASRQRTLRQARDPDAGAPVNTGSHRQGRTHGPPRSGGNADVVAPPQRPTPASEVASAAQRQHQTPQRC